MTNTDLDALFDTPLATEANPGTSISELRAVHDRGRLLLESFADGLPAVFRVRDARTKAWDDADRRHQVTVRVRTAKGDEAAEWTDIKNGRIRRLVYGWLGDDGLESVVVLDPERLAEDILDRPGCLVPPTTGSTLTHHAPGGAEFYVVDIRRVSRHTVLRGEGPIEWATRPAEVAYQGSLFS